MKQRADLKVRPLKIANNINKAAGIFEDNKKIRNISRFKKCFSSNGGVEL